MPIPATPRRTVCLVCGWQRITRQRSDVLMVPNICGACGAQNLRQEPAVALEGVRGHFENILGRIYSRR